MIRRSKVFDRLAKVIPALMLLLGLILPAVSAETSGETIGRLCREIDELKQNLEKEREKNRQLDQELAKKRQELQHIQLWLGGISDQSTSKNILDEYAGLLLQLEVFSDLSCRYTLKNLNLYELMRRELLPECKDEITRSRLAIHLDELEKSARELVAISRPAGKKADTESLRSCRVLEKNSNLGVVLLSVGASDGIAPGLIFHNDDNQIELRIVSVRKRIAAAVPVKGELAAINAGMRFSPLNQNSKTLPFVMPGVKMRLD